MIFRRRSQSRSVSNSKRSPRNNNRFRSRSRSRSNRPDRKNNRSPVAVKKANNLKRTSRSRSPMKARKGAERRMSRSPVINKRKERDSRSPAVNKRRDRDSRSPLNTKRPDRRERDGNKRIDDDKKKRDPKVLDVRSSSKKDDKDELRAADDINAKSKRSKNGNMDSKKDTELMSKELDDEVKEAGTKQSKKNSRSLSRTPSPFLKQHERPTVSVKNSSSANNGNGKSSNHSSNTKKMDKVLQTKARSSSCEEVPMNVVDNKKSSAAKDNIGKKESAEHGDETARSNCNKSTIDDAGGKVVNKKSVSDSKVKQSDVVKRTRDQSDSDQIQKSKNNNSDQSEDETDSEAELKKRKKHAKKQKKSKKHKKHKKSKKEVRGRRSESSDSSEVPEINEDLERELRARALKSMKKAQ